MSSIGRVAIFIDGPNFSRTFKALGIDVDYKRMLDFSRGLGTLLRAYYYTATIEDSEFSSLRPLLDWLSYNGYTVVTRPAREYLDSQNRVRYNGRMGVQIAVDTMSLVSRVDQVVIFSGDGELTCVVDALQRAGVRVTVVSSTRTDPPIASDDLRRQADDFIELSSIAELIGRESGDWSDRAPRFLRETRQGRDSASAAQIKVEKVQL